MYSLWYIGNFSGFSFLIDKSSFLQRKVIDEITCRYGSLPLMCVIIENTAFWARYSIRRKIIIMVTSSLSALIIRLAVLSKRRFKHYRIFTGNELQSNMRQSASLIWFELANLYSMLHACTNKWKSTCQNRHNGLRASKDIYLAPRLKTFFMLKQLRMELLIRLKCWKIDFSCFQTLFNAHDKFHAQMS